jgi:hypothetical protein
MHGTTVKKNIYIYLCPHTHHQQCIMQLSADSVRVAGRGSVETRSQTRQEPDIRKVEEIHGKGWFYGPIKTT